jgi:hypothetical protein
MMQTAIPGSLAVRSGVGGDQILNISTKDVFVIMSSTAPKTRTEKIDTIT